jgi:hypothetical protein
VTDRLPELLDAKAELTTVYIARGKRGIVLYVGITGRNLRRMHAHARASAWWPLAKRLELRHLGTIMEARELERELIERWEPEFNTVYNGKQKDRERAAGGFLTAETLGHELGVPSGMAKRIMRDCPTTVFGQNMYVQRSEVSAWIERHMVPPEAGR